MTSPAPTLRAVGPARADAATPWGRMRREAVAKLSKAAKVLATPLVPADYLDVFAPLRKGADLRARVVAVESETADAATLLLRPGADWAGHVPGQYIRLGVDVDGVRQWRAYSLTHGPRPDGLISVTVKAVPDGLVSPYLVHRLRPGVLAHLEQASGDFVLPAPGTPKHPTKLLCVTAGSGITPVIGMLRNLYPSTAAGVVRTARGATYDITVVHLAPSAPDTIFARDLQSLAAADAIRLVSRYDDVHGLFDVAQLGEIVPDLAERSTLACGPGGLLDALAAHHDAAGLPLSTEQFRPTTIVAGEGGTVAFVRTGTIVEADGGQSLLDAGEAAGVLMPSGCRMGVCFGCVLPLREGAVRDLRNGALTTAVPGETGPEGIPIQTCINAAAGPCEVDV